MVWWAHLGCNVVNDENKCQTEETNSADKEKKIHPNQQFYRDNEVYFCQLTILLLLLLLGKAMHAQPFKPHVVHVGNKINLPTHTLFRTKK